MIEPGSTSRSARSTATTWSPPLALYVTETPRIETAVPAKTSKLFAIFLEVIWAVSGAAAVLGAVGVSFSDNVAPS